MTPAIWNHPTLGRFDWWDDRWQTAIHVPAFTAFSGNRASGLERSLYTLELSPGTNERTPSDAVVHLACRLIDDAEATRVRLLDALWNDILGSTPGSGEFWHGDLPAVTAMLAEAGLPEPVHPADLLPALGLQSIVLRTTDDGILVGEFSFGSAIDPEHGIGILTDDKAVLGIGQMSNVETFARQAELDAFARSREGPTNG
jgi:hypothetical protein